MFKIRKLHRGFEIGRLRFFWTNKNWRSKPRPFWFFASYPNNGTWTFQSMRLEIWKRDF